MNNTELLQLIKFGENIHVEFKKSSDVLTKDVYETVCSFSNRDGGHIFLGVDDKGEITGVSIESVEKIQKDFISSINNKDRVLQLSNFSPYPKNPAISKVFREMGLADELGSGMRNTYKYTKLYSGGIPQFCENRGIEKGKVLKKIDC